MKHNTVTICANNVCSYSYNLEKLDRAFYSFCFPLSLYIFIRVLITTWLITKQLLDRIATLVLDMKVSVTIIKWSKAKYTQGKNIAVFTEHMHWSRKRHMHKMWLTGYIVIPLHITDDMLSVNSNSKSLIQYCNLLIMDFTTFSWISLALYGVPA